VSTADKWATQKADRSAARTAACWEKHWAGSRVTYWVAKTVWHWAASLAVSMV